MSNQQLENCSNCAYAKKEEKSIWCPFHDIPVSSQLICDDYLSEFDSPQWISLREGMNSSAAAQQPVKQYTSGDILVYALTCIAIFIAVAFIFV